jgi:hypothetical protein
MTITKSGIKPITADQAIGLTVLQYLAVLRAQQKDVASHIDCTQSMFSRKLNGITTWRIAELLKLSQLFGVSIEDLMPTEDANGNWVPAPFVPGYAKTPASAGVGVEPPAGIEPATYSLRVNRSAD